MKQVRISELKAHLSAHLRAVEGGEPLEVTDRARPIVRVVPVERTAPGAETIPAERPFASVRRVRLAPLASSKSSLAALQEERGTR